jgi:serine/threonine-protein kinase ATR
MEILRDNKDSLTSVLEAFVHDPLVEWEQARQRSRDGKRDIREWADQSLQPIEAKLRGLVDMKRGMPLSVTNQVETLIKQATSSGNLVSQAKLLY